MNNKHNNTCYCQIRVSGVFISILVVGMFLVSCYFLDEIYHAWLESEGQETVSYVGIESELDNIRECRLCGSSSDSMMDYYRQFNTLGIICVNDWNVLELETRTQDEFGNETKDNLGTRESMGSTSEYKYKTCSVPERGIAEVTIMLPEEYSPNILSLQKILCQECLDKILESLEFDK